MDKLNVGLIQMDVGNKKEENVDRAKVLIKQAVVRGAELVVLPEMFNCPYESHNFPKFAEKEGDYTWQQLAKIASENEIYLVGGSIPEKDEQDRIYNTSYVFDDTGKQIGKHRKMHLFDIDVEGGQTFKESDTLTAGDKVTVFDTPFGKMGLVVCYDFRFPELSRLLVQKGAKFIIVPGAFNMTTGPAHWEILFRTRALDNQVFTIGVAPARKDDGGYVSYANSLIVDPWASIVCRLGDREEVLVQEIDLNKIEKTRQELPLLQHIRKDIYTLKEI